MGSEKEEIKKRIENALWGLFTADALSMPAHWYYNTRNLKRLFGGGVKYYSDPPHPHSESFMNGTEYSPDVKNAIRLGRPYDILHRHASFYRTNYSDNSKSSGDKIKYHYHHGLKAGENTLGASLVRVLIRSVVKNRFYSDKDFLMDFIDYLSVPGKNRDPYTETYIRKWFENYSRGVPPESCAELQKNSWSIDANGGVIRPLVISMLADNSYKGIGIAVEHMNLTHRSENIVSALSILVPLLNSLLNGSDKTETLKKYSSLIHLPEIRGKDLISYYVKNNGPENISERDMWRLHTKLKDESFDVEDFSRKYQEEEVTGTYLSTACYPEHGIPLLLYFAWKYSSDMEGALLANTNAGGDNVHRGMILGLIMGASGSSVSDKLIKGLADYSSLKDEIELFSDLAVSGKAI